MDTIIEFKNVNYKNQDFELKNISFALEKGYVLGISGKNGAGKSTLLKLIMEPERNFTGQILIDGEDIKEKSYKYREKIGFVTADQNFLEEYNIKNNAEFYSKAYDNFDMQIFNDCIKEYEVPENVKYKSLSWGQKIRFMLAFGLAHGSTLFLFDEATAGMDIVFRKDFFKLIRSLIDKNNISVVMVTHLNEELKFQSDYSLVLDNGEIVLFEENVV